jgi:hypothetical protein
MRRDNAIPARDDFEKPVTVYRFTFVFTGGNKATCTGQTIGAVG